VNEVWLVTPAVVIEVVVAIVMSNVTPAVVAAVGSGSDIFSCCSPQLDVAETGVRIK
jgi:hypothetical protein